MAKPAKKEDTNIKKSSQRWQSDVIVDLIKQYGFPYIALNPGASFRGLHDSLVNYGENDPPMLLCNHEKIAVQIAHGYAKASGKPMMAIVHDVVGLLHAPMGIYYAYIDRCPVFVVGATGPMDEKYRRPFIDWIHTAFAQGDVVRNFTKWDYQPGSIHGVPDSFARAYSIMMSEPQGPVYMCYDSALQESKLTENVPLPPDSAVKVPSRIAPEGAAIEQAADMLVAARNPLLLTEYAARMPIGFNSTKEWVHKVWDFDKPYRHVGRELGTGTQIGIAIGVALAHKGTGRLVVDLQPDGDLMFDLGALWMPVKYNIPMLIVMYNNRAYYNDWAHQIHMAHQRGTDPARAHIGMDLEAPPPDFAHIAKGIGWYAEGPIEDPGAVGPALRRAIEQVKAGKPALVDAVVWRRGENA